MKKCKYILLALIIPWLNAMADVPLLLNYQGNVTDTLGATVNGNGYFKFAIVNVAGNTAYWSNDDTTLNGTEPTSYVTNAVTNGSFSMKLGDTNLTNMAALSASVFDNNPVYLRVWFSFDGLNFEQLSPDTQMTSAAFAMKAAVADTVSNIDATQVQTRVAQACTGDDTISAINEDGTVVCQTDDGTIYTAGTGIIINSNTISANETDPTVIASVKDGVSWAEVTGIPADIADGDHGITVESDPQVGTLTSGRLCTTNGFQVNCSTSSVNSTQITDLTISNTDISNSANISASKINTTGLNADTLDGVNSASFARTDISENFDSGTLYIDSITNQVGIGDITPSQKLDVNGNIAATDYEYRSVQNYNYFIPATEFGLHSSDTAYSIPHGYVYHTSAGTKSSRAVVHLPNTALINNLTCIYMDNYGLTGYYFSDFNYYLYARALYYPTSIIGSTTSIVYNNTYVPLNITGGSPRATAQTPANDPAEGNPVNNQSYSYAVVVDYTLPAVHQNLRFYGCRIGYQLSTVSH